MRLILFLISSLIEWVCKKDLHYEPYSATIMGEHYENEKTI